jgi:hypothetical protein
VWQGLLYESSQNNALLDNIIKKTKVGSSSGFTLSTQSLELALASPLFHQWASHSLAMAASITKGQLQFVNNMLTMFRTASGSGGGITERGVEELKIRARTTQSVIKTLEQRLDITMTQFGASIKRDDETKEVNEALVRAMREEAEELIKLDPRKP